MLNCKRCAAVLELDPKTNRETYRIINDPTIGEIRSLRRRGAIILHQTSIRYGNIIHKVWRADNGRPVVCTTIYLQEGRVQS